MKLPILALAALLPGIAIAADQPPAADPAPATTATNQLGLELFREVAASYPGGNVLLSPFSIQSALAMTYAGADGDTRTEMARVLHYPVDDAPLAEDFAKLRGRLDSAARASANQAADATNFGGTMDAIEWHMANRLFGQAGFGFRAPFLAFVKDNYAAPLELVDFKTAYEPARIKINGWVEEQTHQKIRNLIPPQGLDDLTRLVLVNALYLKAPWAVPFGKLATQDRPFQVGGTQAANVPTMRLETALGYAKRTGFTAVTLPYLGGLLQFLVLLPDDPVGLDALAAQATPALFRDSAKLGQHEVVLYLPKFRMEGATVDLTKMLKALGMKTAFDLPMGSANFDRMAPRTPDEYLSISKVFHKAFVALDEEGTEAAAATAVVMSAPGGMPAPRPTPIEVHVDHPFLFAIQLRESGTCIFLGCVTDPR